MLNILRPYNYYLWPVLPRIYRDSKAIRKSVPELPPASHPVGKVFKVNSREFSVLIYGESTMAGLGVERHDLGFAGTLAQELSRNHDASINWKVCARSGYTARMLLDRLVKSWDGGSSDLVIIGLGGNDSFTLNTPSQWNKDILELTKALREKYPQTPILFINLPPVAEFPAFTPLVRKVLGDRVEVLRQQMIVTIKTIPGVSFIEKPIRLDEWIEDLGGVYTNADFFSDGVHPSPLTYQIWARQVAQFIKDNQILI